MRPRCDGPPRARRAAAAAPRPPPPAAQGLRDLPACSLSRSTVRSTARQAACSQMGASSQINKPAHYDLLYMYSQADCMGACSQINKPAQPPAAMRPLLQPFTGMSRYSRRGRGASAPPITLSKYSCPSARTSGSAPLCPPGLPALGREFSNKALFNELLCLPAKNSDFLGPF